MLGLADGGGIRPILASNPGSKLTCVDDDPQALSRCLAIYGEHFPSIGFATFCDDAQTFLDKSRSQYSVIVVDLYTPEAASPLIFSERFHQSLKVLLEPGGVVVANCYGVPMHLAPFVGHSPQATFADAARRHWSYVAFIPHRRNALFVLGDDGVTIRADVSSANLRLGDCLFLRVMKARIRAMQKVPNSAGNFKQTHWTFPEIDQEMRRRWISILPRFSNYLNGLPAMRQPQDLREVLKRPDSCRSTLDRLYEAGDELCLLLPILVAGEINVGNFDANWLPEWVISKMLDSEFVPEDNFLCYILPQALAVVLHGSKKFQANIFAFGQAFDQFEQRIAL
jgi:hypothetical protein